jgi:hypothetical protein
MILRFHNPPVALKGVKKEAEGLALVPPDLLDIVPDTMYVSSGTNE